MNRYTTRVIATYLLLLVTIAGAYSAEQQTGTQLEEFVVSGKQLDVLRKQLIETEDQFFDRYNELVVTKEYQVHCRVERPLGSQIPRRRCSTGFEDNALAQAGGEAARMLQSALNQIRMESAAGRVAEPSAPGTMTSVVPSEIEGKRDAFQRHMKEVVIRDPELLTILVRHAQLMDKYTKVEAELFGSRKRGK